MIADVKISAKEGTASLIVNGRDISSGCTGYTIRHLAGELCKLEVEIPCRLEFDGECEISKVEADG